MWNEVNNQLKATFKFKDFTEAFSFMTEVAFHAEKLNHHPNWSNVWNTVEITLSTHDAGNVVTDKDRQLAALIDQVYKRYNRD
ncbi:MAG: 4a-hydroxytetrahydrobiopterin dehydratase [Saprospiraceae bacterium]